MLPEADIDRYSRHILLREVGVEGQARLRAARVAVDRLDDDARACLLWLSRSGVGTLVVPPDDTPCAPHDASGLLLRADAGRPLSDAVAERLRFHGPGVRVETATAADPVDVTGGAMAALKLVRAIIGDGAGR